MIGVIGRVGEEILTRQARDQPFRLGAIANLPGGENEPQGVAEAIDGDMDFAGQAAARLSDGLILGPPFAPAAC